LITKVSEQILSRLGGHWHHPPAWENTPELADLKQQARAVIEKDFALAEVWGWKDPMTCFTLPFWQQLLPPMRYVICLRNPLDVARSLERRNGFSLEKGFHLWLLYTKFALKHTIGQPRIFVFSEDWINGWQDELRRLSRFVGSPKQAGQADVESAVQTLIAEDLWHYSSSPALLSRALRIYESLLQDEPFKQTAIDQTLQDAIDFIGPEAEKKEARQKQIDHNSLTERLQLATKELDGLIPPAESLILVDDDQLRSKIVAGRHSFPFLERDGQYWGSPPDDATAIREFERLRGSGASFIAFGWPAFWWLDYYQGLNRYLFLQFPCVLHNDRLIVFDLRSGAWEWCRPSLTGSG
jgi:hypothetical protein